MRILMLNKYLYPRAGAETYMLTVAQELIGRGHTVGFVGMGHPDNTTLGPVETVPILDFGSGQSMFGKFRNLGRGVMHAIRGTAQKRFEAFVKEFKPDIIHAHNIYNQINPAITHGTNFVPTMMTVHDFKPICPSYNLFVHGAICARCVPGKFYHCILNRCCHGRFIDSTLAAVSSWGHKHRDTYRKDFCMFVAPSNFIRNRLIDGEHHHLKIAVLNNFAAVPTDWTPPGEGILYIGRLCVEKGVDTLLEAYARLPEPRPILRIAGEGPLSESLHNLAKSRNLTGVQWLNRISPQQVRQELINCGLTVVPSLWYENCSMAIMESLANGRAVITSDSGGNPELVRPGIDGEVFPAGNPDALANAISKIAHDPARLADMGKQARIAGIQRFSPQVHIERLMVLYKTLIATWHPENKTGVDLGINSPPDWRTSDTKETNEKSVIHN